MSRCGILERCAIYTYDEIKYRLYRCNHLLLSYQHMLRIKIVGVHTSFMLFANLFSISENCTLSGTEGVIYSREVSRHCMA
jgi:hypothetical protein